MTGLRNSIALLVCGSFNPPTRAHFRMCELARDYIVQKLACEFLECIISPVSDHFPKPELLSSKHRLKMLELAAEDFDFIHPNSYECTLTSWTKTLNVLKYHKQELEKKYPTKTLQLMLLCGGDLIDAFTHKASKPEQPVWDIQDVKEIIRDFGLIVIDRLGANTNESFVKLNLSDDLQKNVMFITNFEKEDVSSTKVRICIRDNLPFKHLTFDKVADYIQENKLYSKPTLN